MMEIDVQFIIKILEELDQNEMRKLKSWLNTVGLNGERIPGGKLEDSDAVMTANLIFSHFHPKHLKALQHGLDAIPKKQLVEKVSIKIDAAKKEHGNQTEEVDGVPAEKLNFSERPAYEGDFILSDMEVYATENQDLLIKDLKEHLEPSAFKILEEELARRVLKNAFMFTGPQYYTLFINQDLKCFFDNVIAGKKSQKVPSKILDILFAKKNKRKREAVDEDKFQSNLLYAQEMSQPRVKKPIPSSPFRSTGEQKPSDERKELPTNKEKEDSQIFKEDTFTTNDHGSEDKWQESLANNENNINISTQKSSADDLDVNYDDEEARDYKKELPANKQNQISKVGTFAEYRDVDCDEQKPVYESKNTASKKIDEVPENEQYEPLVRAIGKHYKEKRYCLDLICIRYHKKYHCFIAQDVLLFRLADETEYRILRSLQGKKDLTSNNMLKKTVEFELQFNMAVLGVERSELLSDNTLHRVKARSFRDSEEFLENIVSLIVLPVLALYKRVKLDTLQSLGATKDISLPRMEQQKATQIHVRSA